MRATNVKAEKTFLYIVHLCRVFVCVREWSEQKRIRILYLNRKWSEYNYNIFGCFFGALIFFFFLTKEPPGKNARERVRENEIEKARR